MASRRHGLSGETSSSKRSGTYMETSSEDFPPSLSRRARKAAENARLNSADNQPPKNNTKIPQTSSRHAPSQSYSWKQNLARETRPAGSSVSNISDTTSRSALSHSTATSKPSQDSSKHPRNLLRRKQPAPNQELAHGQYHNRNASARSDSSSSVPQSQVSLDSQLDRGLTDSPAEISIAQRVEIPTTNAQTVTIYPELDRYRDFKPQPSTTQQYFEVPYPISTDLPPPTPLFSGASSQHSTFSGSPSTRFSESPGPGPYSRDTTPTSMSSQSPGIAVPMRIPMPKSKQGSPAAVRPPVMRLRAGSASNDRECNTDYPSLPGVRESSTSNSSNSTLRASATMDTQKKKRLETAAPTPPIRKSSEQYSRSRDPALSTSRGIREPVKPAPRTSSAPQFHEDINTSRETSQMHAPRMAPSRPSRDGTSDLHSQIGLPVPIVHSNLSSTSLSDKRRSNQNLPIGGSRTTTPLQSEQSQPASRPRIGREPTPSPYNSKTTSNTQDKQTTRSALRTPSPSVSSSLKSRFPLFGRRTKAAPDTSSTTAEKKERAPRKGPAAGTGHEGYGRLGQVRRRSGNLTSAIRAIPGTMSSQESLASPPPSDPFLASRMSPVIIAGGTVIENRNNSSELSRTESSQSIALPRPGLAGSRNASEASLSSQEARNTLWPSALPRGSQNGPSTGHRRLPSDSSDSDVLSMKPTLAYRRSLQRLKNAEHENMRLPKPIIVRNGSTTPAITSHDTSLLSDDSTFSSRPSMTNARHESPVPKKLTKKPKSPRKWNIFGRSSSQPADKKKQPEQRKVSAPVKQVQQKPVAFYTMIDSSEREDNDLPDVEDVLREAQSSQLSSPKRAPSNTERRPSLLPRNQSQQSVASSSATQESERPPPKKTAAAMSDRSRQDSSSEATQQKLPMGSKPPSAWRNRPTRLPQVGRIPQVAARPEPDPPLPSPVSFSRPLNRSSLQLQHPSNSQSSVALSVVQDPTPSEPPSPTMAPSHRESRSCMRTEENSTSSSTATEDLPAQTSQSQARDEFLTFPPRKGSEGTSTTESSSASGILSYSDATAIIPGPETPLAEDEVWDEYNDLLGDNDIPRGHPSTSSSLGRPFHLEVWGKRLAVESDQPMVSPTINKPMAAQMDEIIIDSVESECETEFEAEPMDDEPAPTASSVYSSDITAKINEVLDAAGAPRSPFSVNDFISGYGSQSNSLESSRPQSQRLSTSSSQLARVVRNSQASSSTQSSDDTSTVAQVNLRVGSMQVSKWLTFGHVLFSPVRDELLPMVGSLNRHSILVIDGLGNDDWSFYAAETYPAATFFNLSPRMPLPTGQQGSQTTSPLSPPNHHQIYYKSNADKFPFGTQSFTCVVYRFPTAAPESHYRNVINEARRVLKPGGYIELSILDVDMNNMGNRARRAVRRLKERVHIRSPDINLASSSDLLLRLLGRKGFTDIKTCRVGVPLASTISESSNLGPDSSSSSSRAGATSASSRPSAVRRVKRETRSLAEMMKAEGPGADEGITKMVAKVGRWWYDRCYESVALESGGKSMWTDRLLLTECEEWRTSLKLMVCHARIPDGRSRVASI